MIHQWLYLEKQRGVRDGEEICDPSKITSYQFLHPNLIMTFAFRHISLVTMKPSWFNGIKLMLHCFHI
jgi:hypothetical protein